MDALLEQIANALAQDATPDQRAAGARAAQTIATALSAKPGEPLVAEAPAPVEQSQAGEEQAGKTSDAEPSAAAGGPPPLDALDVLIAKLASYLPPDAKPQAGRKSLRVPFVPVPVAERGPSHS